MADEPISCAECGETAPSGAAYCPACGTPLPGTSAAECPSCGRPNPEDSRFCARCGESLASLAGAERRIVTVLFADLSGFTPVTERLDPEAVHQMVTSLLSPLCDCVTRWGGSVDKFIGDCVMALFGAPVALENEAESALRAALEMQETVARWDEEFGGRWQQEADREGGLEDVYRPRLSIGVNTGEVVTGVFTGGGARDYTAVGDAVNVAARLEGVCEAGATLVAEETVRRARHAFRFGDARSLELKGRRQPVRARYLEGLRERRRSRRGFGDRKIPLVGREGELEELRSVWNRATEGSFETVLLFGAPGIGKTRLVEELASREALSADRMARGRSYPHSAATPWGSVADMLRSLFGIPADASADEAMDSVVNRDSSFWRPDERAALAVAFGRDPAGGAAELESAGPEERRERVISAAIRAVRVGARSDTHLLVADDLHWADRASLHFYQDLASRHPEVSGLVILVTRPPLPDQERLRSLMEGIPREIELDSLSRDASRRLLDSALGEHQLPEALLEELVDRAGGNPLFIEEALRTLRTEEVITREGGTWRATADLHELELPDSVESVLSSRIDGLPSPAKRVLQYASVVGRRFWSGVLTDALVERSVERELSLLDQGEFVKRQRRSLIEGEREYAFRHLLLQEVAYEGLLHASRRELHGEVARWLEQELPEATREYGEWVAFHYERSDEPERAVAHLERTARSARDRGSLEDAAALAERALEASGGEGPQGASRRRILCLLDDVSAALGNDDRRLEVLDELSRLAGDEPESRAEAAYRRLGFLLDNGRLEEAEKDGEEALVGFRELGDQSREADTLVRLGRVWHLRGDYPEAMERYRDSLRLQRRAGDRRGEAEVLDRLGLVEVDWGRFMQARERFEAASAIYGEIGHPASRARVGAHAATALRWLGCLKEAEEEARAALDLADASGSRRARASTALTLASVLADRGRCEEAESLIEDVLTFADEAGRPGTEARAWLARAQMQTGAEGRRHAERARDAAERSGLVHVEILALARQAELALEEGDLDTADEESEEALSGLRRQSHVQGPEERVLWTRSRVQSAIGRETLASELAEEARETVRQKADWIEDPELRDRFLEAVPLNAEILGAGKASPAAEAAE